MWIFKIKKAPPWFALFIPCFLPVLLKLDNLQPSGSFKIRGIGLTVQRAVADGVKQLVGCSGGNAGLAMSHAAERSTVSHTLFGPKSTNPMIFEKNMVGGGGDQPGQLDPVSDRFFFSFPVVRRS